jgi:hypothetical protein
LAVAAPYQQGCSRAAARHQQCDDSRLHEEHGASDVPDQKCNKISKLASPGRTRSDKNCHRLTRLATPSQPKRATGAPDEWSRTPEISRSMICKSPVRVFR